MKHRLAAILLSVVVFFLLGTDVSAAGAGDIARGGKLFLKQIAVVANLLDMTPRAVMRAVQDGATIAELAEDHGVAFEKLAAAVAEPKRQQLDSLVQQGVLTREQATYMLERAEERMERFLTLSGREALLHEGLEAFAAALDIPIEELSKALRDGMTPSQLISEQGATVEQVVQLIVAAREKDLQDRVELDLMSETQKDLLLARYEQRLAVLLSR